MKLKVGDRFISHWWQVGQFDYAEVWHVDEENNRVDVWLEKLVPDEHDITGPFAWELDRIEAGFENGTYANWLIPSTDNAWDDGRLGRDERTVARVAA
jgi:hypothetical protein